MDTPTEQQLFLQIKSSEPAALEEVFRRYHQPIFNFISYKLDHPQVAEDILQEVFIRLWENRHQIKENLSLKSYLYTIANNLVLNYFRHKNVVLKYRNRQAVVQGEESEVASPETLLQQQEFRDRLMHAIESLPEKVRVVFMMSRFDNLTYKEIATRLNISVKTVESHIGKALKLLKKSLSD